jgi:isochorismate synthase
MRQNRTTAGTSDRAEGVLGPLSDGVVALPARGTVLLTVPAPRAPLERVWGGDGDGPAVLWTDPRGRSLAGVGAAVDVSAGGEGRFELVSAAASALAGATQVVREAAEAPVAAMIGGFAFAPGSPATCWERFGEARFVLPRWSYEHHVGGAATLTLALGPGERPSAGELVAEGAQIIERLATSSPPTPAIDERRLVSMEPEAWSALVEGARAAISRGELGKVVLARRFDASLVGLADARSLLASLRANGAGIYRFGFRFGPVTFLGASPELLVARRGSRVESEAVAGSMALAPGNDERVAAALLADAKQRDEHEVVARAVRGSLAPLCTTLITADQPRVRRLRRVAHLCLPFAGELREALDVVQLAARLHPTPAVGGEPLERALDFIATREPVGRGWYAGPVGIVDARGDGAFAVALRGALVEDTELKVWAGAGIIAASEPAAEYAETALKGYATLAALGLLR